MKLYNSNEYRATKEWPYAISAGSVVYRVVDRRPEVLLLKRKVGHSHNPQNIAIYNVPKGHCERNETIEQTAMRETKEETGCTVTLETYLGATLRSYIHPVYNVLIDKTTHYFAGLLQSDGDSMDKEHDSKLWVSANEAIDLLQMTSVKRGEAEIIQRLLRFLELTNAT